MPETTFVVTPRAETEGGVLLLEVPERAVRALSERKRPPVKVTINGFTYPTTVAVYGGRYYLPVRREVREAAKLEAGKRVTVRLVLDTAVRTVDLPPELSRALAGDRAAKAFFDGLAFTPRREYAEWITSAKREGTRASRLARTMAALRAGAKESRA